MSAPKTFPIKETESTLKKLMKSNNPMIAKRIHSLLIFKRHEHTGVSKRIVAEQIGVNHNSVQAWRSLYIEGGIELLTSHSNIGYKPSKITALQEQGLKDQLNNPKNGMVGFVELLDWFNHTYQTTLNYKTFHGYVVRKFKAKVKVARKMHIKKDPNAVEAFKKTSTKSAKKSFPKNRASSKA